MRKSALQEFGETIEKLASSKNLRHSSDIKINQFSFFYFGIHPCPESWQVKRLQTLGGYNVSYFSPASEAKENLELIYKEIPDSKLIRPFVYCARQITESGRNDIFCRDFIARGLEDVEPVLTSYINIIATKTKKAMPQSL